MNKEIIYDALRELSLKINDETNNCLNILLSHAGVSHDISDPKELQVKLIENGYDIVYYTFQGSPQKKLIALTDIKNKFIIGYLIDIIIEGTKIKVIKELVNSKSKFKKIIMQSG